MIFQKSSAKISLENELMRGSVHAKAEAEHRDDVETVVGPSVNVEGDFSSEGNIIVKGTVAGSIHTSKHLLVEEGAKIMANVRSGSAKIAGEVRGNMKVKEVVELTSTAKVLGDIEAKILVVEGGALLYGKVMMPGIEAAEIKGQVTRPGRVVKKSEESLLVQ